MLLWFRLSDFILVIVCTIVTRFPLIRALQRLLNRWVMRLGVIHWQSSISLIWNWLRVCLWLKLVWVLLRAILPLTLEIDSVDHHVRQIIFKSHLAIEVLIFILARIWMRPICLHPSDLVTILQQTLTALLPFKIKVLNLVRLILRNRVAYVLTNLVIERRLFYVLHPLIWIQNGGFHSISLDLILGSVKHLKVVHQF